MGSDNLIYSVNGLFDNYKEFQKSKGIEKFDFYSRPQKLDLYMYLKYCFEFPCFNASKTETLDLCQLSRSPYEIHKIINFPASVKILKN